VTANTFNLKLRASSSIHKRDTYYITKKQVENTHKQSVYKATTTTIFINLLLN